MNIIEYPPTTEVLPAEIVEAYALHPEKIRKLGGGLVNATYTAERVDAIPRSAILQKLGPAINAAQTTELSIISEHLSAAGWEAPQPLLNSNGAITTTDTYGNHWRALRRIAADANPPEVISATTAEKLGALLGRWHGTMRWLDFTPQFTIPHYRDTTYHASTLMKNSDLLPTTMAKKAAEAVLTTYAQLDRLPDTPSQLIHGDTKIDNVLFKNGKPLTFIDLDTVMKGTVWLDIGDLLRSIAARGLRKTGMIEPELLEDCVAGYFDASRPGIYLKDVTHHSLQATAQISLELAMRYLSDIVSEDYFAWDTTAYQTRHDNHLAKVTAYHDIATTIIKGGK